MRRRARAADSLELLLDTLCNTFGGVLFIAMLVVVLLQLTGGQLDRQRAATAIPNVERLERELRQLREEIESLRQVERNQARVADSALVRDVSRREQEARSLRERLASLNRDRDRRLLEIADGESSLAQTEQDEARLRDQIRTSQERLTTLERELQAEQRQRARTLGSPRVRSTGKRPVACELRYGRFYILHNYRDGERDGPNLDEYVLVEPDAAPIVIQPDPTSGTPALPAEDLQDRLASRLRQFPPGKHYLDLIVRTDSFDQFHEFRQTLSGLGYELSLMMVNLGESVMDRGGMARGVQ